MIWIWGEIWGQTCYAQEPERFTYESPVFFENEKKKEPEETIEQGEKIYQRVSMELRDAREEGTRTYVSTSVSYQLEENQEPPDSVVVTMIDDRTGESYDREVLKREAEEKGKSWDANFSFPLTVYGYDADVFLLGNYEIPSTADLSEYGLEFLEVMGLSQEAYRINRVEWRGEMYEEDGILCRDAMAYGEKLIRQVEVVYGGQIRTPDRVGKQYVAVYEEQVDENVKETEISKVSIEEVKNENEQAQKFVSESEKSVVDGIKQWIREQVTTIVFGGLFLGGILFFMLFYRFSHKHRKGEAGD